MITFSAFAARADLSQAQEIKDWVKRSPALHPDTRILVDAAALHSHSDRLLDLICKAARTTETATLSAPKLLKVAVRAGQAGRH